MLKCVFYGWWIVVAAFLNLFLAVGIVYYGLPVFYVSLVESLHFSRQQVAFGIFLGFALVAPVSGVVAGALIDRLGARRIILLGIGLSGGSLVLLGGIHGLWQYYLLCIAEVVGYVLAGPIPNQVLVANWFCAKRGRAMGYAYLGLGVGGTVSPLLIQWLIESWGWRNAFRVVGAIILVVLFPVGVFITRSLPREMGLLADGAGAGSFAPAASEPERTSVRLAVRSANFWLLLAGSTLAIGAIGTVIFHFVLFLHDQGHSAEWASRALSLLLTSSLGGRVVVGYLADRFTLKNLMALFYLILSLAIPLLFLRSHSIAVLAFSAIFGFAMGADYMLIPLVTAHNFGLSALGKILALIIMADSLGQTFGPVLAGRIYDTRHSYDLVWLIITAAGILGAILIYFISARRITHN
ncbi:MAG TPA: MFS transporter [Terriglobales bacterium]|nr:MFS transporter [Terriglobales bacterium]